jgi:hypothetical protein
MTRHTLRKKLKKTRLEGTAEVKTEGSVQPGRKRKQLLDEFQERRCWKLQKGSSRSHSVLNSFWNKLQTRRKTNYMVMMMMMMFMMILELSVQMKTWIEDGCK